MASIVFECRLDDTTQKALSELRSLRHQVLNDLLININGTMQHLVAAKTVEVDEARKQKPHVQGEVQAKLDELERRMQDPDVFFADEIEMYLDLLGSE